MKLSFWDKVVIFLFLGYFTAGRTFAYIGVPQAKIFIGDVTLFAFCFFRFRETLGYWIHSVFRGTRLSGFAISHCLFLAYGIIEVIRGISFGFKSIIAIENVVFNIYPLFFVLGVWVGGRNPAVLAKCVRLLAWINGLYGIAFVAFLNKLPTKMPGSPDVMLFGQPGGSAVAIAGLLCFGGPRNLIWLPMILNILTLLGVQVRDEWLALIASLLVWGLITKRMGRLATIAAVGVVVMAIGFVTDIKLPGSAGRGGDISARIIIARVLAPIMKEEAEQYTTGAATYAGTVEWRKKWWRAIRASALSENRLLFLGHGYGFPLAGLVTYVDANTRTPHSIFYYTLGYTGAIGISLFALLQFQILALMWKTFRLTGQAFGVMVWVQVLTSSQFANRLENPFGAIPYYLVTGLVAAIYINAKASTPVELSAPVIAQPAPVHQFAHPVTSS